MRTYLTSLAPAADAVVGFASIALFVLSLWCIAVMVSP